MFSWNVNTIYVVKQQTTIPGCPEGVSSCSETEEFQGTCATPLAGGPLQTGKTLKQQQT